MESHDTTPEPRRTPRKPPARSRTTQTSTATPRKPPARSRTTQTATATPRKPPARSRTTQTATATPRKPPARSAPAEHAALLASLRSAAVLAVPGFADRAGPFHSHPVGWTGWAIPWGWTSQRFPGAGRASGSLGMDGPAVPWGWTGQRFPGAGRISRPSHSGQPPPPQPIRSLAPVGARPLIPRTSRRDTSLRSGRACARRPHREGVGYGV